MNLGTSDLNFGPQSLNKTWYASNESGYSGPFTQQEVLALIKQKKLTEYTSLWNKDFAKWNLISEIKIFQNALISADREPEVQPKWQASDEFWKDMRSRYQFQSMEFHDSNDEKLHVRSRTSQASRSTRGFAIGLMVSVLVVIFFTLDFKKFGADLPQLSKEENRELKAAVAENPKVMGPSAAVGLVINEISFIIGSNQPDGSELLLKIEGIPETLVGHYEVSLQTQLTITNGLAHTQKVYLNSQKELLPKGEYKVSVACVHCLLTNDEVASGKKLTEKVYFLGGYKNIDYDFKLRKYHEQLRTKARTELLEIKQLGDTLERQLVDLSSQFESRKTSTLGENKKWQMIESQLSEMIKAIDARASRGEVYYVQLFNLLKVVEQNVNLTYQLQAKFISLLASSTLPADDLDSRIAQQSALAQSTLLSLRTKEIEVENLPLSANGMPRTE